MPHFTLQRFICYSTSFEFLLLSAAQSSLFWRNLSSSSVSRNHFAVSSFASSCELFPIKRRVFPVPFCL